MPEAQVRAKEMTVIMSAVSSLSIDCHQLSRPPVNHFRHPLQGHDGRLRL